jgi:hypothetical protein
MRRPVRRILTTGELSMLKRHEADMTAQLETPTLMMGSDGQIIRVADKSNLENPQQVSAEIRKARKAIEEGTPFDLTKAEIRERDREIKRLEEQVKKKMIPEKNFRMADDGSSDYRKVVNELVNQAKDHRLTEDINVLKNLRRERNPDDPNAGNIEDLRRS